MQFFYNFLIVLGIVIAVAYTVLVMITSKGDAMSGGSSSIRTTFKGKAGFDDIMSKILLYLGLSFLALMVIVDYAGNHLANK